MDDTRMLTINEDVCGHTIVHERLTDWVPPNDFLRRLVDSAESADDGTASDIDSEGCEVTAVIR